MKGSSWPSTGANLSSPKAWLRVTTKPRRYMPFYGIAIFVTLLLLNVDLFAPLFAQSNLLSRSQLILSLPPRPVHAFPSKIWQLWKVGSLDFEEREEFNSRTWQEKNPSMRYEVLTDNNELSFIEQHFGPNGFNRPDIIAFYRTVNLPIVKADLLRYMVMYAEGGVYADIDVEALRSVDRFVPERYDEADIDMIIGVEIDQPEFRDHPILGRKSMSFCQWTFISRPLQPVMLRLVESIMQWLEGVARSQGVGLGEVELDFDQVIEGTGPSAFTIALLEEMNRKSFGQHITWETFHDMDESKIVGRILVLDVEAFCAGQGHSNSGNHDARGALVKHHFHASHWPERHPRYTHPAYGSVENCNWDSECVREWDENVASWDSLGEDVQQRIIEEHQIVLEY